MNSHVHPDVISKFFVNTDDTGRFVYSSKRTGRTYFVEPIITEHTPQWGSIDPATGNLMNKKGTGKYRGGVSPNESIVTPENGFRNVRTLDRGTSPLMAIDYIDSQYPDAVDA